MYFAVPLSHSFGTNDKVRKLESVDKLNAFLLRLEPSDKFMIIEGNEVSWSKTSSIELKTNR